MMWREKLAAFLVVLLFAAFLSTATGVWCSDPQFVAGEAVVIDGGAEACVVEISVCTWSTPIYKVALKGSGGITLRVDERQIHKETGR